MCMHASAQEVRALLDKGVHPDGKDNNFVDLHVIVFVFVLLFGDALVLG